MRTANLRDDVIFAAADLLLIDTSRDLPTEQVRPWVRAINRNLPKAIKFWDWPEWSVTEERAFRPVWNEELVFSEGAEFYYLAGTQYYRAILDAPAGYAPTNTIFFEPITLSERYLSYTERCRRTMGEVLGVFPTNPRVNGGRGVPGIPFRPSERGIDVLGGGNTVFVHYRLPVPQFSAELHDPARSYARGDVIYWTDGNCYRAMNPSTGKNPPSAVYWMRIPFPAFAAEYCVNAVAAEAAEDEQQKLDFLAGAKAALQQEADALMAQGQRISYGGQRSDIRCQRVPYGVSGFWWSVWAPWSDSGVESPPSQGSGVAGTLSNECQNEWGEPDPTGGVATVIVPQEPLTYIDGLRVGDAGVTPGRALEEEPTELREMYCVVTIVYGAPRSESDWQLVPAAADPAVPEDEVQPLDNDAMAVGIPLRHWVKVGGR